MHFDSFLNSNPHVISASDEEIGWKEDGGGSSPSCSENGSDTVRRAKISEMQARLDKIRKRLQDTVKGKEDANAKYEQVGIRS